jgi:hypothetical protein
MEPVHLFAIVLLVLAVVLVAGAEWPRLSARLGFEGRTARSRARRKQRLRVVRGDGIDEDFAASVERDLANLPTIGEPDDRSRR